MEQLYRAARDACLWLPEAGEFVSHGAPSFKVRGKTFATYMHNHHGDKRVALWLNAPAGAQQLYVTAEPTLFFVPPYVGPRGWLGVDLNRGLSWRTITALVREAYVKVAPPRLHAVIGAAPRIRPPRKLAAAAITPLESLHGKAVLRAMRAIAARLPETCEALQFGNPVWRAGRKTFARALPIDGRLSLCFWVGAAGQSLLTLDARHGIPAYMGHNGWIALDVSRHFDVAEIADLALQSYRHFALRRMLDSLEHAAFG